MIMKWKRQIRHAVFGLIALGFAACTQNEDMAPTLKGQEINASFNVGSVSTRVNIFDHGDEWESGDQIRVEVSTDTKEATTGVVTYDADNQMWPNNSSFRWLSVNETHTVVASTSLQEGYESFTLPEDQTTLQDLKKADLINGVWIGLPSWAIQIPMQHRMSMVTVTYKIGTADYPDMDMSEPQVYSKSPSAAFALDKDAGGLVKQWPSGNPIWVKACMHDNNKFSAIVTPGSYKSGEIFLKFKIGDKDFKAKMRMDTEFQEDCRYTYELQVGKNKYELNPTSVDDLAGWDSDNEEELK